MHYNSPSLGGTCAATLRVTLLRLISTKSEIYKCALGISTTTKNSLTEQNALVSPILCIHSFTGFDRTETLKLSPANGFSRFHHFVQRHLGPAIVRSLKITITWQPMPRCNGSKYMAHSMYYLPLLGYLLTIWPVLRNKSIENSERN